MTSENQAQSSQATIIVRGETVADQSLPASGMAQAAAQASPAEKQETQNEVTTEEVSPERARMKSRLPALDDDADVGLEKEQLVIRDNKADLTFTGTLLASAASGPPVEESWEEYRIYETTGGKHVFSKVTRSVSADTPDRHEAEVFDPDPSSVTSQLLQTARDAIRSRPMTWTDAAVKFFGYTPLSKTLYRKLGSQFDDHIG